MSTRKSASQIHDDLAAAWIQFKQHGSATARDFIIEHYRYLISKTRQRIIPTVPTKIAPEDLEQEGLIALIKAVDQFERLSVPESDRLIGTHHPLSISCVKVDRHAAERLAPFDH